VAFAAFQLNLDVQLWVLILMDIAFAVSGYVVFEFVLSADEREKEWLNRVGTPARLDLYQEGMAAAASIVEAVKAMSPGSDITIMFYSGSEGGKRIITRERGARHSRETFQLDPRTAEPRHDA
jgi:hypothetical protein